jgi:hypothetical protein
MIAWATAFLVVVVAAWVPIRAAAKPGTFDLPHYTDVPNHVVRAGQPLRLSARCARAAAGQSYDFGLALERSGEKVASIERAVNGGDELVLAVAASDLLPGRYRFEARHVGRVYTEEFEAVVAPAEQCVGATVVVSGETADKQLVTAGEGPMASTRPIGLNFNCAHPADGVSYAFEFTVEPAGGGKPAFVGRGATATAHGEAHGQLLIKPGTLTPGKYEIVSRHAGAVVETLALEIVPGTMQPKTAFDLPAKGTRADWPGDYEYFSSGMNATGTRSYGVSHCLQIRRIGGGLEARFSVGENADLDPSVQQWRGGLDGDTLALSTDDGKLAMRLSKQVAKRNVRLTNLCYQSDGCTEPEGDEYVKRDREVCFDATD